MVVKIDKGVAISSVNRTLDSMYVAIEHESFKLKSEEDQNNLTKSITDYELVLKKLKENATLNTVEYKLLYLSFNVNSQMLEGKAQEYQRASIGMKKYANEIGEYLLFLENKNKEEK